MNPEQPQSPREELELKITALLLGELDAAEAGRVRKAIEQDPELTKLHDQLRHTLGLVKEASSDFNDDTEPLRLSDDKREILLARFRTIKPGAFRRPKPTTPRFRILELAAVLAIIALLAAMLLPSLSSSKSKAHSIAIRSNLREIELAKLLWADDHGKSPDDVPTKGDLEPYLREWPTSVRGEDYIPGRLSEPVTATSGSDVFPGLEVIPSDNGMKRYQLADSSFRHDGELAPETPLTPLVPELESQLVSHFKNDPDGLLRTGRLKSRSQVEIALPDEPPGRDESSYFNEAAKGYAFSRRIGDNVEDLRQKSKDNLAWNGRFENNEAAPDQYGIAGGSHAAAGQVIAGAYSQADVQADFAAVPHTSATAAMPARQSAQTRESARSPVRFVDPKASQSLDRIAGGMNLAWSDGNRIALPREESNSASTGYDNQASMDTKTTTELSVLAGKEETLRVYGEAGGLVDGSEGFADAKLESLGAGVVRPPAVAYSDSTLADQRNIDRRKPTKKPAPQRGGDIPVAGPSVFGSLNEAGQQEARAFEEAGVATFKLQTDVAEGVATSLRRAVNKPEHDGVSGIRLQPDRAPVRKSAPKPPTPQPEVRTAANPFSTFSLNVSDVSFKLAAASLAQGQMPNVATVRSEEFINAFNYRDPAPIGGQPLAFAWERSRYPFAHNRDLLRFSVQTAAMGREAGRPLNLVLLLDNSGSMERSDRVDIIRECLNVLSGQLTPQDKVSVVTFARTARLWVDGVPGVQAAASLATAGQLTPEGGTNLEEAMRLAYATAQRHYLENGVNRVVLLTDGAANLGNADPETLKGHVEVQRRQGIALDCFGIGWEGYNDDLLEVLSRNGDGRYGFVNTPDDASTGFASQLAGALQVAASDVKVQVQFNPQRVTAYRQIGYAKHQLTKEQFRDNTVDAAEIGSAESGNALYVIETNPRGTGPVAIVRARFKIPATGQYREYEWTVPYTGEAIALENASATMRLAASASGFSEWLVSSPYAGEVSTDRLLQLLSGVPEVFGADSRPRKLEGMIREAGRIAGN